MIGFGETTYSSFEYERNREHRVKETELQRRANSPREALFAFVSLLEDGDAGSIRKLSRVEEVREGVRAGSRVYVVEFDLLHPYSEEEQATASAYFADGLYLGQEKEGTSLYVEGEVLPGARVTSGYFLNIPKIETPDTLMTEVMEARLRDDDFLI